MRVILAPMQGVLDPFVRQLLTEVNDYDLCITEFVRVVDQLLPEKVFYRLCPELKNQGFTSSSTPVRVQLLGQHPECLAENAIRAIELGSHGIDLNCGCPSKTVNGSNGGAALLKQPELIYRATQALRQAVPSEFPVSVKVRLGWDNISQAFEIADAVEQKGEQPKLQFMDAQKLMVIVLIELIGKKLAKFESIYPFLLLLTEKFGIGKMGKIAYLKQVVRI